MTFKSLAFTSAQILAIKPDQPEALFSGPDMIADEHRDLMKLWHPDRNSDALAAKVSAHINDLTSVAKVRAKAGKWTVPGELTLASRTGQKMLVRFKRDFNMEFGRMVYGRTSLAYIVDQDFSDLFENARKQIVSLSFASDRMRNEMVKYLPDTKCSIELEDGKKAFLLNKTDDVFLLRDVLEVKGGALEPRGAAWVISALYNIACYLQYAQISHNSLTIDTVFISPKFHSALLLGGWWYSIRIGEPLKALPKWTHSIAPRDVLKSKIATAEIDLVSIRAIGRQILGDQSGMTLETRGVPKPMSDFLRRPAGTSAREEYAAWDRILIESFGPKKFTEMTIDETAIFNL